MIDRAVSADAIVPESALAHYREHGFAVLRDVMPPALRAAGFALIEPWIDHWVDQWGYSGHAVETGDELGRRFLEAWRAVGQPHIRRRPNKHLINEAMYAFFRSERLLAIAQRVIGTPELSVHGIFNARAQLPDSPDTMTPFHQDAQYWRLNYDSAPDLVGSTHVMTIWMPLQAVDARSGTLGMISAQECGHQMIEPHDYGYERTGFIGLAPKLVERFTVLPPALGPGDALIFNQLTPHGAMPNEVDRIRWSIDVRYEATATATLGGRKFGFVAQSFENPASVTPVEEWLRKRQS